MPDLDYGPDVPKVGSVWRHAKGYLYKVVAIAHLEASPDAGPQVVYTSAEQQGRPNWVRAAREWHEMVSHNGPTREMRPRFQLVEDG